MKIFKSVVLIGISILAMVGCGNTIPTPTAKSSVLVGQVKNSDALVAIVRDENGFIAYICGGESTWQTQTGWFRSAGLDSTQLESSSGLQFSGTLDDTTAQGSVTLKDGTKLTWSAETAVGAAGLFILEDADVLTGLIQDNKGNTAGTARALTETGFGSSPVQVSSPVQAGANTVTGTALVNNAFRNFSLVRAVDPGLVMVVANPTAPAPSPTVIVLLHGATNRFSAPDAKGLALDGIPGTRRHARLFWTEPFVDGLLGGEKRDPLVTLTGTNVAGAGFYSTALPADPNSIPAPDVCDLDDFVTTQDRLVSATQPPAVSALLTHRNAGLSLVDQVVDASIQIQSCLETYKTKYNRTPQLIFVGHSMGGLVARFLLSRPTTNSVQTTINNGILSNPTNGTMTRYSANAFANMEFLRNRTTYVVTLATPHEGSRLADQRQPIRTKLLAIRAWVLSGTPDPTAFNLGLADVQLAIKIASAAYLNSGFSIPNTASINISAIKSEIIEWLKAPSSKLLATLNTLIQAIDNTNATAIRDLTSAALLGLNTGILSPERMARGADSPIPDARNRLIPIHVAGARSAGGEVYDSLDLNNIFQTFKNYNDLLPTFEGESRAVEYIKQAMMAHEALNTIVGPKTATDARLDKRKYTDWLSEVTTQTENAIGGTLPRTLRLWRYIKTRTSTPINTAAVNYILTKIIVGTGSPRTPVYLKNKWRVDFSGQETINVPALICRDGNGSILATITIDLELFLQFLVRGGRTFEDGLDVINSSSFANFLSNLGDLGADFLTLAADIKAFLNEKRNEIANLNDACTGPIDTLTNWSFGKVRQNVSAPRLFETNEPDSDGAVENDSLVEYDSAMGFRLSTSIVDFFDHTRTDHTVAQKPAPGSWYRFYSSGLEPFNHDIMHKDVGQWISRTFIEPSTPAGAFVCPTGTISSTTVCN